MQSVKLPAATGLLRRLRKFDWRRVVGFIGTTLIVSGLLILGLIAYQLWGTGIQTREAQRSLKNDFAAMVSSTTSSTSTPNTTPEKIEIPTPEDGEVIAYMHVEKMNLDVFVVQGVRYQDLRTGPGHYPSTPMIGEPGNASIAGHRTTYDAPFGDIEKLEPGDEIVFDTSYGHFTYIVDSHEIVDPTNVSVVANNTPALSTLTLTSCHPKYSSTKRYVVKATLKPEVSTPITVVSKPQTPTEEPVATTEEAFAEGWWHDAAAWPQVLLWTGALLLLVAAVIVTKRRFAQRLRRAHWIAVAIVAVPFLISLYFFYENLSRLLPTNL